MTEEQLRLLQSIEAKISNLEVGLQSTSDELSNIKKSVEIIKTLEDIQPAESEVAPEAVTTSETNMLVPVLSENITDEFTFIPEVANAGAALEIQSAEKSLSTSMLESANEDFNHGSVANSEPAYTYTYDSTAHEHKARDIEALLGKNTMAIGASLLIFIAIAMFASVISPYLTAGIKMALMFGFSLAFVGAGELYERRKSNRNWGMALSGCGIGALLISLFVSFGYFKAFNLGVLYTAVTVLTLYICYLGKKRSFVFSIIGQLGILISLIFSLELIGEDYAFAVVMTLLLLMELPYFISDWFDRRMSSVIITWAGTTGSVFLYTLIYIIDTHLTFNRPYPIGLEWIGWAISLAMALYATYASGRSIKSDSGEHAHCVQVIINTLICGFAIIGFVHGAHGTVDCRNEFWILAVALFVFNIFYFERFLRIGVGLKYTFQGTLMGLVIISLINNNQSIACILAPALMIGLLVYYYRTKNVFYRYIALSLVIHSITKFAEHNPVRYVEIGLMIATFIVEAIIRSKKQMEKDWLFNNILYVLSLSSVVDICASSYNKLPISVDAKMILMVVLFFVVQMAVVLTKWVEKDGQLKYNAVYYIGHVLITVYSIFVLFNVKGTLAFTLASILLLALCSMNNKVILKESGNNMVYIAIQYTIAFLFILNTSHVSGVGFSITFLILAILSIAYGFIKDDKSIRIYGLVTSLFSIVKLILWDITYKGTAVRALGFLVCGLLCFGISYIYHKVDSQEVKAIFKKMAKESVEEEKSADN